MTKQGRSFSRDPLPGVDTLVDAFGILVEVGFRVHPVVFRFHGRLEIDESVSDDEYEEQIGSLPVHFMQSLVEPDAIAWNNLATWFPESKTLTLHGTSDQPGRPLLDAGPPDDALGEDCGRILLPYLATTPETQPLLEAVANVALEAHEETGSTTHIWLGYQDVEGLVVCVRTSLDGAPPEGEFSTCSPIHCAKVPEGPVFEDILAIADMIEPHEQRWHEAYVRMLKSSDPSLAREAEPIDMTYRLDAAINPYREIISVCAGEPWWAMDEKLQDDSNDFIPFMGCDPSVPGRGPSFVLRKIVECQSLEQGALLAAGSPGSPADRLH